MAIIQFKDVWEMYRINFIIDGRSTWDNFWALKELTFNIEKGETVGIIGENGAGKSTILKLIAGMLKADRGEVIVSGRVSGLLELGSGFQPELTGKDNIYLNASLFGLKKDEIEKKYEEIVSFVDIGRFIHAPVKCYSQGMFVRLAFAIAIHVDPDILLIDDSLSVGDEYFQRKCIKKIFEIKEQGKTIIFVTHDMNMLSRLCDRAIFIKEGRIVKDDSKDKVIPLYSQMVGEGRGVAVLNRGSLSLVFNNGRLLLNWKNKLITPNSGAHTVLRIADVWYHSSQADWQVSRESENKIVCIGTFYHLAIKQIWEIELLGSLDINIDIEIYSQQDAYIQEGSMSILLSCEYNKWLTSLESGDFPNIEHHNKKWQDFLKNSLSRFSLGAVSDNNDEGAVPGIVFEERDSGIQSYAQISNSDYIAYCRALQYRMLLAKGESAESQERYKFFSGKILLDIKNTKSYLQNSPQNKFILSKAGLQLVFEEERVKVYYNGTALTKGSHMHSCICVQDKWYSSHCAHWMLTKESETKFVAKLKWSGLSLIQVWEIEVESESSFKWRVDLEVSEEISIVGQRIQIDSSEEYNSWISDYGSGLFPPEFYEAEMDILQRCIPDGSVGLQSKNSLFPPLLLNINKIVNIFSKIFSSDFYNRTRILRLDRVEPEVESVLPPGKCNCFEARIFVNQKQVLPEYPKDILQKQKLKLLFDKGAGRIFWEGVELTKKLGFYTSIRLGGRWHDSFSSALWKILHNDERSIKALGKWLHLPISQSWQISLEGTNCFDVYISMIAEEDIEIERLQANLMISERYPHWESGNAKGDFPSFRSDIGDDWDCVVSAGRESSSIGASFNAGHDNALPSVSLSFKGSSLQGSLNVLNSDLFHRARLLQYLVAERTKIQPGEYLCFHGRIAVL